MSEGKEKKEILLESCEIVDSKSVPTHGLFFMRLNDGKH